MSGKLSELGGVAEPSFVHGQYSFKRDDCALINAGGAATKAYIGRIRSITAKGGADNVKIQIAWFYRPEETKSGRQAFHGEKEVFQSDHLDWCHKNAIIGKCRVLTLEGYQNLTAIGENDFYCRFFYSPSSGEFSPDDVPVFCLCEMPYNPDRVMIACDKCDEWFHPECLGLSKGEVDQVVRSSQPFVCPQCVAQLAPETEEANDRFTSLER
ncbi:hypothetical protein BSKO_08138 [Bryopsis sp. KO-2023]|nr:hypothetical protein BSKO_08138 [Bryopsis sp. KO-2023]